MKNQQRNLGSTLGYTSWEMLNRQSFQIFRSISGPPKKSVDLSKYDHNSGVIHAGNYTPDSLKAELCVEGLDLSYKFFDEEKVSYKKTGKLIKAVEPEHVPRSETLFTRAQMNEYRDIEMIDSKRMIEIEPHCSRSLWSPHTEIVDGGYVMKMFGEDFGERGSKIYTSYPLEKIEDNLEGTAHPIQVSSDPSIDISISPSDLLEDTILRFVMNMSVDHEEAETFFKTYTDSHIKAVVPDDVLLHLTSKSITPASDISEIVLKLERSTSLVRCRELRPNRFLVNIRLTDLYTVAIQKSPSTSSKLLTSCLKLEFDRSADIFMKCFGELQSLDDNFLKSFGEWKKLSKKYGTLQGIDNYWIAALNSEGPIEKRIEALLSHSKTSEHPFATMARMICAFVKSNQLDKALEVFQTVSISGKHFKQPLESFVEKKDLKCIEQLATLVERGMIAERRRGGGQRATNKTSVEKEKTRLLSDGVHAVLTKFYGVSGQKKTKFVDKKLKKKIHRVDEQQLHELCKAIQNAWIQCADGKESLERLVVWCKSNRVEIDEKMQKRINSFSK
uniref:L-2-hydroxyglutarate dehydrogenase, mitochondrial n=1 Tax=Caenorhabditis tropicalis TaxID=1561998 RepID=A0A1I7UVG1_9PELO